MTHTRIMPHLVWLLHLTFGSVPNNSSEILQQLSMTYTMSYLPASIYPKAIQMVGYITLIPGPNISALPQAKLPLKSMEALPEVGQSLTRYKECIFDCSKKRYIGGG